MQNNNTNTIVRSTTIDPMVMIGQNIDDPYIDDQVSSDEYESDNQPTVNQFKTGFIDINALYKKTPNVEIKRIDKTLEKLSETTYKYMLHVKVLWEAEIEPFLNSPDCLILEKLSPMNYDRFLDFMCEQKTFRLMMTAQKRLMARREYLESIAP